MTHFKAYKLSLEYKLVVSKPERKKELIFRIWKVNKIDEICESFDV